MSLIAKLVKRFAPAPDSAGFELNVELEAGGGITALFGVSGAGKSLTLDCIAGFVRPDAGRILLGDAILYDGATGVHVASRDRGCGYVFQTHALFPHMTVRENLRFAAEGHARLQRHRRVAEMIERFRLAGVAGRKPHEISGGQRQRCSIARALIAEPRALLLDEPAAGLDAALRGEFHALLRGLRSETKIPILLVTHDVDEAAVLADRMLVYESGRIVQSDAPQVVLSRPASLAVAQLLGPFTTMPVEIVGLDPGRGTSRLKLEHGLVTGPYLPGRLLGDRATLLVRGDDLRVSAIAGDNRVAARLENVLFHARGVEMAFAGGIVALAPRHEYEACREVGSWFVEFPPSSIRVI